MTAKDAGKRKSAPVRKCRRQPWLPTPEQRDLFDHPNFGELRAFAMWLCRPRVIKRSRAG